MSKIEGKVRRLLGIGGPELTVIEGGESGSPVRVERAVRK